MANNLAKVVITLDGSRVEVGLDKIRQKTRDLTREMDNLAREGKQNTKEFKERVKAVNKLHKAEEDVVNATERINKYMKDLGNVATVDLRRAYQEGIKLREGFKGTDKELQKLNSDLAAMKAQIDKNTNATSAMTKAQMGFSGALSTTLKNLVAYAGVFAMFNRLKGLFEEMVTKNREFSDQLANIRKVSGLAMEDINTLANRLATIDTRSSVQQLNELAYTGSKLGFGELGIDALEGFVKSALKVENALKESMGPESMTHLSKMVEVMGLIPKMGVEKAMDATGSAIFKLASTSTATGTNIVEFSKRLMGLANIAHISVPELLAFASAADSMAIAPEVGATAFNKLITAVQKQPNLIENALHIEPGTINDMFKVGKMADAMVLIFEKMREKGGMNALMHAGVFKDLGSDGARLVGVMATMANRVDILNKHMATSRQAFSEATAVQQEYTIQMETAEAYMERAANMWTKAFVNPEGVDLTKEFAKAWYDVSVSLTQTESSALGIKIVMNSIFGILKLIVELIPALIAGFSTWGVTAGMASLLKWLRETGGLLVALRKGIAALSWTGWAGIITGVAMAAMTLYENLKLMNDEFKKTKFMADFKDDLSDLNLEFGKGRAELDRYTKAINDATVGTKQRAAAINNFNSRFKQYLTNMLNEKSTANDIADAYREVIKVMRAKMALQLKEKDIEKEVTPRVGWAVQRREEYDKMVRGTNMSQYNGEWLYGFAQDIKGKGMSVKQIADKLNKEVFGIDDATMKNVLGQLGSGTFNELVSKTVKRGSSKRTETEILGPNAKRVWAAMRYIIQDLAADTANSRVNKKYAPEEKSINDYLASQVKEETVDALQDAPDKNADKELRKQQQEYKQQLRKDLKDAKEESDAIISKIEEWYRLQETVLTDMAADGRLTQEQADQAIRTLNIAKNQALRDARLAISGRDTAAWEKTKQQIGNFMIDQGEWSQQLLAQILDVSMKSIRDNLSRIDKGGGQFGITTSSLRDAVDKNAAGNQREIARLMNKSSEEVEKLLERYNYLEQATKLFEKNLVQIGVLSITAEQLQNQLQGVPDAKATTDATMSMLAALLQQGTKLFAVNPSDATAVAEAIREVVYKPLTESDYLAGRTEGQQAKWFDMFPAIKDWMANPEKHKQELENFYNVVLIAEQDYYTKRKQSYQNTSKQMENRFRAAGYTDSEQRIDTQLQGEDTLRDNGVGATFWEQQGLGSIADDPEIKRIQNRIYWRQKEVDAAKENLEALKQQQTEEMQLARDRQASDEELQQLEAEHDAARMGMEDLLHEKKTELFERETELTSKVAQELQKRIQTINNLTKPVQDAANNVGKKLGEMIAGAKEESITWEQIWKSMAIAVGESVIDMMAAYAQNLIMEKAMNAQSKSEAIEKAEVDVAAGTASAASKTLGTLGWWGIALIPVIAALLKGLLQSAFATANKNSSSGTKVKLVSGMLTYDEGNVGQYVGNDGNVYTARQQSSVPEGVSLVSQPIATTINGQPSLVAEKGPEIVIGRRTTRQIMMNEPALLHHLANYGGGGMRRLYDEGNVGDIIGNDGSLDITGSGAGRGVLDGETAAALRALPAAMAAFSQMMGTIQKQGIPAKMARFGEGSLDEGMRDVEDYRRRYPRQ